MQLAETRDLSLLRACVYELVCIYELRNMIGYIGARQKHVSVSHTCCIARLAANHVRALQRRFCSQCRYQRMWPDKNELRPSSVLSGTPWGSFCNGSFLVTSSSLKSQQWMVQSCCCLVDLAAGPVGGCKWKVVFGHGYIKMCEKKTSYVSPPCCIKRPHPKKEYADVYFY